MALVANPYSGTLLGAGLTPAALAERLRAAGLDPLPMADAAGPDELLAAAIALRPDAVVVAGGDGTVNAAVQALLGSGLPLGIVPGGTLNLLAKDLGIPLEIDAAIAALASAVPRTIDVGMVNGHAFACASMLGLPARLARHRERGRGTLWGNLRFALAALSAPARIPRMQLGFRIDGRAFRARTHALAVTPGVLEQGPSRPLARAGLETGRLAVYRIPRITLWNVARITLRLASGGWTRDPDVHWTETRAFVVTSGRRAVRVMNDGEVLLLRPPLRYRVLPRSLTVLAPSGP